MRKTDSKFYLLHFCDNLLKPPFLYKICTWLKFIYFLCVKTILLLFSTLREIVYQNVVLFVKTQLRYIKSILVSI